MALVTGELSNLVALDFDLGAGVELLHHLKLEPHVRSPSGGYHVYVRHPGWHVPTLNAKANSNLPLGLDIRGDGGLVMLPPSTTDVGAYVRLAGKKVLTRQSIPETVTLNGTVFALRRLCGLAAEPVSGPDRDEITLPESGTGTSRDVGELIDYALCVARQRGRNEGGFVLARSLRDHHYESWETLEVGPYWVSLQPPLNTKGRHEAYTPEEFRATVRSVYRRTQRRL